MAAPLWKVVSSPMEPQRATANNMQMEVFANNMSTDKHYFIEQMKDGRYAIRPKGSERAAGTFDTQREAIERANQLNPDDHPDVERVRNTDVGGRDKWRRA
jgi:hypothetical protein